MKLYEKYPLTINLWFEHKAEEAAKYYTSVFKDGKILNTTYFGKEGYEIHKMPEGTVMTIDFEIHGARFVILNGGPMFKLTEAVSFIITCDTQEEIDYYWENLGKGGDPNAQQCGWVKDKYGVSWQVVPAILDKLIADPNREKAGKAMNAMLQMKKLDIKKLEDAFNG